MTNAQQVSDDHMVVEVFFCKKCKITHKVGNCKGTEKAPKRLQITSK